MFYVKGRTGKRREIMAIVDRSTVADYQASGTKLVWVATCSVLDSATLGISLTELDQGQDYIEVAPRPGQALSKRRIFELIETDGGVVMMALR